jgi:hypothetical protein
MAGPESYFAAQLEQSVQTLLFFEAKPSKKSATIADIRIIDALTAHRPSTSIQKGISEECQPKAAQYERTAKNHRECVTPARREPASKCTDHRARAKGHKPEHRRSG